MTTLKVKIVRRPQIKVKAWVKFPANVDTENFLTVTNTNGTYTFSVDYSLLGPGPILDPATAYVAISDTTAGVYRTVTLASLLTSGLDADLQAIAALTGTGILARTADGTWALRTLTAPAAGITITNGGGVTGNPTLALANDLAAVEGLASTGIARRTGTDAWSVGTAVANSELGTMAAYTIKANATGSAAVPTDVSIPALTQKASPVAGDKIMIADSAASNAMKYATVLSLQSAVAGLSQSQVRLSLTNAVAITTSDVTAATTIYLMAGSCPTSDGTNLVPNVSAQLSVALDSNSGHTGYHQSGKNFDVFKINDAGTMRIGTGPTWNSGAVAGSDTARGTGSGSTDLAFLGNTGILTNANTITIRFGSASGNTVSVPTNQAIYLGTFRTTADGQTEDSLAKRFLWNAYNQAPRQMRIIDATTSWNYSSLTIRQANGNAANQIDFISGLGSAVSAEIQVVCQNNTATVRNVNFSITLDATNVLGITSGLASVTNAGYVDNTQKYRGYPGLGRHFLVWVEAGAGSDTQTWFGSPYSQLTGEIWG